MKHILRTDEGPDITVETLHRSGHAQIICGRSAKLVGEISIYGAGNNVVIYVCDRRKPIGKNRQAYTFLAETRAEKIMEVTGGGWPMKEALRKAGYDDSSVTVRAEEMVVDGP